MPFRRTSGCTEPRDRALFTDRELWRGVGDPEALAAKVAASLMQQFLQHNWVWMLGAWIALFALVVAKNWSLYKRHRTIFPPVSQQTVRFDESGASGCSHKTLFTKFGGARNCLRVTVTDAEVWIRTMGLPFDILAWRLDLEHRIPRGCILGTQQRHSGSRALLLDYRDARGEERRFSLLLRRPDDFRTALALRPQAV